MDLLIEREGGRQMKLSEFGVVVHDIEASSPSLKTDRREIRSRSGVVLSSSQFVDKTIKVDGYLYASTMLEYETVKDQLNSWLVTLRPLFITKLLPETDALYAYERPGEHSGDLSFLDVAHVPYKYGYEVLINGGLLFSFLGQSKRGLLFKFHCEFITASLPFGQTRAKTLAVSGHRIPYLGTAEASQIEHPWVLELVANGSQSGTFSVQIGQRVFEHKSQTGLNAGDRFVIKGYETLKNDRNVNHFTNSEHFVLYDDGNGGVDVSTNFQGSMSIKNYVEFYK